MLDPRGNQAVHISSATTTQVATGRGDLYAVIVNTTAAGSITILDGTAAASTTIAVLQASVLPGTFIYDCNFANGLRIVTAGASDITVSYKQA